MELITRVIQRLTFLRRSNLLLAALCPILILLLIFFFSRADRSALWLHALLWVLGLVTCAWFAVRSYRFVYRASSEDAARVIDRATRGKERFLTLASLSNLKASDEQLLAEVARQATQLSENFSLSVALPFSLERPAKYSLVASPFLVALLALVFYHSTHRSGQITVADMQTAEELTSLAENLSALPLSVKGDLLELAALAKEEGVSSDQFKSSLEDSLENLQKLENQNPEEQAKEEQEEKKEEQAKAPEEQTPQPDKKQEQQGKSSEQEQAGKGQSAEKKQGSKGESGDQNGESGQGKGKQGQGKEDASPNEGQGSSQQSEKGAKGQGKSDEKGTSGEASQSTDKKQDSGKGGDSKNSDKDQANDGQSKSEQGSASGKGEQQAAELKKVENTLEDLKKENQEKSEQQSQSDGKQQDEKQQDGKQQNDKQDQKGNQQKADQQNKDGSNSSAGTGDKKSENVKQGEKPASEEPAKKGNKEGKPEKQSANEQQGEKTSGPKQKTGDDQSGQSKDSATGKDQIGNYDRPPEVPEPSDTAPRFGPLDGGKEGSLDSPNAQHQKLDVPLEEKVVVRGVGNGDEMRYRNPNQAKAATKLGGTEFKKPNADLAQSRQPIPVEYRDVLR